jgi:hypothetical protein
MGATRAREEKPTETPEMSGLTSKIFNSLSFRYPPVKPLKNPFVTTLYNKHRPVVEVAKGHMAVNSTAMLS